ncbi:MAG: UDP-N-acetylmuramoyl-tripeptide--D-alanyl-D-alanine ligase [Tahibacter sp.]
MLNLRASEVALWTRGQLIGADVTLRGVAIDTRKIEGGELFVALQGEHQDGHAFVAAAAAAGAGAALVARRVDVDLPQVMVAETQMALGDLASAVRAQHPTRVVGITGSNGKTTVKTLVASILKRHGRTHVNPGNLNNEIGLPLTLLAMPPDSEYAVLEMGAGKPGDIQYLAAIARPEVALVNNIAPAHLERMLSVEGIAQTKGALYSALPGNGFAVINADDAFADYFNEVASGRQVLQFGLVKKADIHGENLELGDTSRFVLQTPQGGIAIHLALPGRHNVMNALAASAIAYALQVPLSVIRDGLEAAEPVGGRLVATRVAAGWTLIDDSYNANPASTAAAIQVLMLGDRPGWLVLGDMRELGPDAPRLHAEIGHLARQSGVARLYTVGSLAQAASEAYGSGSRHFSDQDSLLRALADDLAPGIRCLVKGSRSSAMDRIVAALLQKGGSAHAA